MTQSELLYPHPSGSGSLQGNLRRAIVHQKPFDFSRQKLLLVRFLDPQGEPFTWGAIAQGLCHIPEFRGVWNQAWASPEFDFHWKPVPLHPATSATLPFFAALVPSTFEPADPSEFQPYLQALGPEDLVATFSNLSGDALLVSPKVMGNFGHIADFCRQAPEELHQALWTRVGEIIQTALQQQQALWCNTHGHGVPWLHVRFDNRLKYAAFPPHDQINPVTQALWYQNYELCFQTQVLGQRHNQEKN